MGLWAPSLEGRQMVTKLNSAFHFNIGNVFNSLHVSKKRQVAETSCWKFINESLGGPPEVFHMSLQPACSHLEWELCPMAMTFQASQPHSILTVT